MEDDRQISAHVKYHEIKCHCGICDGGTVSPYILAAFEEIRHECGGKPITITSGFRCPTWNKSVGGVATSYHMRGLALDLLFPPHIDKREFYLSCARHSQGCGLYSWGCHIDVGRTKKQWIDKSYHASNKRVGTGTGQAGKCSGFGESNEKKVAPVSTMAQKKIPKEVER